MSASTDVTAADRVMEHLHPAFALALLDLFQELGRAKLAVFMTQGWRCSERQLWLYESGRSRPGPILTYARPMRSHHNLIVRGRPAAAAADFAIWDEDKPWSKSLEWQGSAREWEIFADAAAAAGLRTLSFERPHVELPYPLADLAAGHYWPRGLALPDPEPGDGR